MKSTAHSWIAAALALGAGCGQTPVTRQEKAATPPSKPSFTVYVSNEISGDVSVIDGDRLERIATIPVGKRPRGIHVSPDGRSVYVALSGSPPAPPGVDESTLPPPDKSADGIGVIGTAAAKLVRIIKCGSDPEQFDLSKDGSLLFVSNEDEGKLSVVDIAAGSILASLPAGGEAEGVTTSPDGKLVYVTSEEEGTVTAVDVPSRKAIRTFRTGRRPRSVAFLPNGKHAYVTNENDGAVSLVDSVQHRLIRQIRLGETGKVKPMHVTMTADGATAYVSSGRGKRVFAIDTAANTVKGSVEVGDRPWGITLSPDNKTLFAADGPSGSVIVVDLASMAVVKRIKAGEGPWGVTTVR